MDKDIIELEIIEKYNPYHDRLGRFTTPGGATSFTVGNKSGLAWNKKNVERAKEREQYRTGEHEYHQRKIAWYKNQIKNESKYERVAMKSEDYAKVAEARLRKRQLQAELAAAESSYKKAIPELDNVPFW